MPQCPHCQAEFEPGQRYCKVCGSYLLHPETGDTFCPQCGIRVSHRQEFCHECDAPLKGQEAASPEAAAVEPAETGAPGEPAAAAPVAAAPAAPAKGPAPLLIGLLIGAGVIILILLIVIFTRTQTPAPKAPPPAPKASAPAPPAPQAAAPAPQTAAPAPQAAAPAPAPPAAPAPEAQAAGLKEQLQAVLTNMRQARLNKDIVLLMNSYSVTFPDLEDKRSEALKSWENYDYTNMVFTIDEVQPLDADNAKAQVTWYVDLKNRRTGELISTTQSFEVRFAKELGQWRIRAVEEIE